MVFCIFALNQYYVIMEVSEFSLWLVAKFSKYSTIALILASLFGFINWYWVFVPYVCFIAVMCVTFFVLDYLIKKGKV